MSPSNRGQVQGERWVRLAKQFRVDYPHVGAWLQSSDEFSELRFKNRDDGTVLAIAKGYSADGGPIVAFGVGYDVTLSLMALDSTIQGGHWREDTPWENRSK